MAKSNLQIVKKITLSLFLIFFIIRPFEKTGHIMGTRAAGGVQSICPLNNFNRFHCIIIKLCENVCWQNIAAKFNNQPDLMKHFGVMALVLAKFAKISVVPSVTQMFFIGSSSNLVTMFENEPHCLKCLGVMALDLSKTVQIKLIL